MTSEGENETAVYPSVKLGAGAFALRVLGDSMVDVGGPLSFPPGCIIIVDPTRKANPGDNVVVKLATAEGAVFNQLETDGAAQFLKPLNSRYPIMPLPPDAVILGVVVHMQIDVPRGAARAA